MFLVLDPYRHTHSAQNGFRLLTHGFVHQRVGVQAAGAGTMSTAVFGITRTTGRFPPSQRSRSPMRTPAATETTPAGACAVPPWRARWRGRQRLRFDGEYQDIGTRGNGGIVGVDLKPKQLRRAIALRGVGIRENQAATVPAAVDKAAGEAQALCCRRR